jgi:alanine dehydrogenase
MGISSICVRRRRRAVAAKYLTREDSTRLCILGSGGMDRGHAESLCAVRDISLIDVFSPNEAHREEFAREIGQQLQVEVRVHSRAEDAVAGSDIVACCTNSTREAVLMGNWVEPGMHITTVLGAELGPDAAELVGYSVKNQPVRDVRSHFAVVGDPPEGVVPRPQGWRPPAVTDDMPLLSNVILGNAPGRTSDNQVTYFSDNKGIGIQFASAGAAVLERLAARDFAGVAKAPLDWFVQDIRD